MKRREQNAEESTRPENVRRIFHAWINRRLLNESATWRALLCFFFLQKKLFTDSRNILAFFKNFQDLSKLWICCIFYCYLETFNDFIALCDMLMDDWNIQDDRMKFFISFDISATFFSSIWDVRNVANLRNESFILKAVIRYLLKKSFSFNKTCYQGINTMIFK